MTATGVDLQVTAAWSRTVPVIRHILLFQFRDRGSASAIAAEGKRRLEGMVGKVEQIRSLEAGVNVVHSARAYDLALTVTFDSLDDLDGYAVHPDHEVVAEWLRAQTESVVAADYEV